MSSDITPDLRLILVGSQRYGAASVANAILGGEFEWGRRIAQSVTHTGQVNGKVIQLVKAPVWLRSYPLCDTAEIVKEELVLCADRCKPGPHAFILLVEVDLPFTSGCAKAVEAHLELYGKDMWSHTIVLFTCMDWLGGTSVEEYIAGEGEGLKQLLKKCGQRYIFDCTNERQTLSQRLLDKIQALMMSNEGRHFEVEKNVLQKILKKREEVEKRAEIRRQRRIKEKMQENESETSMDLTIVLLGWVFSAKTAVGSAILGIPEREGRTEKCVKETKTIVVGKRQLKVTVVDTPGWWKFFSANLVPSGVKSEIMKALEQDQAATHPSATESPQDQTSSGRAFLLMLPADTSFTNAEKKIIEDNMRPLGETVWQNTILVFTRCQWLGECHIEQHIESEGDALIWLVEKCGNRYFAFNNEAKELGNAETQAEELLDTVIKMVSRGQSTPKVEKQQTAESKDLTEASEGPVDVDLKKMVENLHRIWGWGSWEIEEVVARYDERPMQVCTCDDGSLWRLINLKTHQKREDVEKVLREETCDKNLEEVMDIVLQVYFRKECGAFDIVSIICEKDTFKPEWKDLFEREWGRREVRMMEHVFETYVRHQKAACLIDASDAGTQKMDSIDKVSAWLKEQISDYMEIKKFNEEKSTESKCKSIYTVY